MPDFPRQIHGVLLHHVRAGNKARAIIPETIKGVLPLADYDNSTVSERSIIDTSCFAKWIPWEATRTLMVSRSIAIG